MNGSTAVVEPGVPDRLDGAFTPGASSRVATGTPSILVAIASYGRRQDQYLERVLAAYNGTRFRCRVVVLSDRPKPVGKAELHVGLPTANPYSLPFAHRTLFAENVERHDLFVYTEDDTLLTPSHIDALLALQGHLADDEILGFLRSEAAPSDERYITSVNHFFRWRPETIVARAGELFAEFSNEHSGCFVATRAQLKRAIASGGFLVAPHDEMYGMLESAASDIYRQCGLRRLICVSRVQDFIVPHLPNKYFRDMGVSLAELELQLEALKTVYGSSQWTGMLFSPETRAHAFRWSKNLYEKVDESLLAMVTPRTRRLLSIGTGLGLTEQALAQRGIEVHAVAIDAVFAETLRAKGIAATSGHLDEALAGLGYMRFDTVLVPDVLHLVAHPAAWLRKLRETLVPGGDLIARIPNTGDVGYWLKDLWLRRPRRRFPVYRSTRVQPVSAARLRQWCRAGGLQRVDLRSLMPVERRTKLGHLGAGPLESLFATTFLLRAFRD